MQLIPNCLLNTGNPQLKVKAFREKSWAEICRTLDTEILENFLQLWKQNDLKCHH